MPPDFSRDVHCILGLPFDAVTEAGAEQQLRAHAREGRRCFLSTPNLNFAVQCTSDDDFRLSVQQSDLSLADGFPIVMVSRWLGVNLPERVAGSTVFERLQAPAPEPLTVYFFGGPPGAAEIAGQRVNVAHAQGGGMRCVGHDDAGGFGSVEAMSSLPRIAAINDSGADFLVVALGARKGQAWIQHNLAQLVTPIVSHLGAVVNFAAGTVRRAPPWAQRLKLEWLWRIVEEPALWQRYASDGLRFAKLMLTQVLPLAVQLRTRQPHTEAWTQSGLHLERRADHTLVQLQGAWAQRNAAPLRQALQRLSEEDLPVRFDFSKLEHADMAVLGLLSLMHGWSLHQGWGWQVTAASHRFRQTAHRACADYLLRPVAPKAR